MYKVYSAEAARHYSVQLMEAHARVQNCEQMLSLYDLCGRQRSRADLIDIQKLSAKVYHHFFWQCRKENADNGSEQTVLAK